MQFKLVSSTRKYLFFPHVDDAIKLLNEADYKSKLLELRYDIYQVVRNEKGIYLQWILDVNH